MQKEIDKRDCAELIQAVFHFVDYHKFDEITAIFTEDAIIEFPDMTAKGHDQILNIWAERSSKVITRHVHGQPYFERIDESTAESVTQVTLYRAVKEDGDIPIAQTPVALGELRDKFVKTANGWKISHRVASPVMLVSK